MFRVRVSGNGMGLGGEASVGNDSAVVVKACVQGLMTELRNKVPFSRSLAAHTLRLLKLHARQLYEVKVSPPR